MALYDGFPSIHLEGNRTRALALIPEAKALLYKVQKVRENAGVETFSMTLAVGEDAHIYALSSLDVHVLYISVDVEVPEQINPEIEEGESVVTPDFLSGAVINGYLERRVTTVDGGTVVYNTCAKFAPTPSCRRTANLLEGRQDSSRLAVTPGPAFDVLRSKSPEVEFTQYTRLRSSMYSGTMRKVAQVVMGLGHINPAALRDPKLHTPDGDYIRNVKDFGVQVRYDWRFLRTHGITRASDGSLWLVEISSNQGVLAMRLPIFPHSDTQGFYDAAVAREDTAMVTALDELGCLPTGEAFPPLGRMAAAIASGKVFRLLTATEIRPFYECSAYSSYMGWAFNSSGSEAHNTAYRFDEIGFQQGVWYQININISVPTNAPIVASAELRRQAESPIYCPPAPRGNPARYVPFKCYEPLIGGLLSHEGVGLESTQGLAPPDVDTVMFVMFAGDELKAVKYFRQEAPTGYNIATDETEGVECLLGGSWEMHNTTGVTSFPTMMYTNDFDDRRALFGVDRRSRLTSTRLGYDPPRVFDFVEAPSTGVVTRNLIFRQSTVTVTRSGERMYSAVAVPEFSRESYYYAQAEEAAAGVSKATSVSYDGVGDPNIGFTWRCWPGLFDALPPDRPECNTSVCRGDATCLPGGIGLPKNRLVVCFGTFPGRCSELADSGPWLNICDNADSFTLPAPVRPPSETNEFLGTLPQAKLLLVTQGYNGPITLTTSFETVLNVWMLPSPDPVSGSTQNIQAMHNAIGGDTVLYTSDMSKFDVIVRGYLPTNVTGYPTLIGVVSP